jgi:hypothetical protein
MVDRNLPPNEWFVEKDGRRYARLRGPWGCTEMFWQTFTVIPETDDPILLAALWSKPWWHACGHTYVCALSGIRTGIAFAGGLTPTPEAPLVLIRSLYLHDSERLQRVLPWRERLHLWARRALTYLAG